MQYTNIMIDQYKLHGKIAIYTQIVNHQPFLEHRNT